MLDTKPLVMSSSFKSAYILDNYFSQEQQNQESAQQAIPGTV